MFHGGSSCFKELLAMGNNVISLVTIYVCSFFVASGMKSESTKPSCGSTDTDATWEIRWKVIR